MSERFGPSKETLGQMLQGSNEEKEGRKEGSREKTFLPRPKLLDR